MKNQTVRTSKGIVLGRFLLAGFHVSREKTVAKEAVGQESAKMLRV